MSKGSYEVFRASADSVGLMPEEVGDLWRICAGLGQYTLYANLRANSAELAARYSDYVQFEPECAIAGDGRPIGVTTIWSRGGGATAYVEGRQHALEAVGSEGATVIAQLLARHPGILQRFGYQNLVVCDHIDPAGEAMQTWGPQPPSGILPFAYGAWRGAWKDQHSWRYPTATFWDICPETELSMRLLKANPDCVFALHGSTLGNYVVASSNARGLAPDLSKLLSASGLLLNLDQPEAPDTPILAPAVFEAVNKEQFDEQRIVPKEPVAGEGGTNVLDVVEPSTVVLIPELAWAESTAGDAPSGITHLEAIEIRAGIISATIDCIERGLDAVDPWARDNMNQLTVQLLYDAVAWYRDTISGVAVKQVEAAVDSKKAHDILTKAQYTQTVGAFGVEALVYAGNMQRLARQAGNVALQRSLEDHICQGAEKIGPVRPVPIARQVALQALLVLAGMRYAAQR